MSNASSVACLRKTAATRSLLRLRRLMRVQQRLAREFDLPGQVAMEQQMACGLGLCFCCVRDFNIEGEIMQRRVCWEGPVFDLMEALP